MICQDSPLRCLPTSFRDFSVIVLRCERKPFVSGSFEKVFLKGELDGADCITFEEFSVGSEAEGFQHTGLHLLG